MYPFQIVAILGSLILFVFVIELIRRRRLKEKYSILWLVACLVILILSFWKELLDIVSKFVGIFYPPSFLFLSALVFLIVIILHFSVTISDLSEKVKRMTQEIALLKMDKEGEKPRRMANSELDTN